LSTIEQQTIKQSIKKSLNEWSKYRILLQKVELWNYMKLYTMTLKYIHDRNNIHQLGWTTETKEWIGQNITANYNTEH